MEKLIQIKRGLKEDIPTDLALAEPVWTTDTKEMYVGDGEGGYDPVSGSAFEVLYETLTPTGGYVGYVKDDLLSLGLLGQTGLIEDVGGSRFRFKKSGTYLITFFFNIGSSEAVPKGQIFKVGFDLGGNSEFVAEAYCHGFEEVTTHIDATIYGQGVVRISEEDTTKSFALKNESDASAPRLMISYRGSTMSILRLSN